MGNTERFNDQNWNLCGELSPECKIYKNKQTPYNQIECYEMKGIPQANIERCDPFIVHLFNKTSYYQSGVHFSQLYIERVTFRLCSVNKLHFPDLLHVYYQALNGYNFLIRTNYYPFIVKPQMICFCDGNIAKVWVNSYLGQEKAEGSRVYESFMIESILDVIQIKKDFDCKLSFKNYVEMNIKESTLTFQNVLKLFKKYVQQFYFGQIPNCLKICQKFGGVAKYLQMEKKLLKQAKQLSNKKEINNNFIQNQSILTKQFLNKKQNNVNTTNFWVTNNQINNSQKKNKTLLTSDYKFDFRRNTYERAQIQSFSYNSPKIFFASQHKASANMSVIQSAIVHQKRNMVQKNQIALKYIPNSTSQQQIINSTPKNKMHKHSSMSLPINNLSVSKDNPQKHRSFEASERMNEREIRRMPRNIIQMKKNFHNIVINPLRSKRKLGGFLQNHHLAKKKKIMPPLLRAISQRQEEDQIDNHSFKYSSLVIQTSFNQKGNTYFKS